MRSYQLSRPVSFFDSFDKEFDRFFNPVSNEERKWKPFSRVKEEKNHYHLALDIPGVDKEDLKVELNDNILAISGERKDEFEKENVSFKSFGKFEQRFSLPKDVQAAEIEVNQHNGVLDIVIPKIDKVEERKNIEIKSGKSNLLSGLLK